MSLREVSGSKCANFGILSEKDFRFLKLDGVAGQLSSLFFETKFFNFEMILKSSLSSSASISGG